MTDFGGVRGGVLLRLIAAKVQGPSTSAEVTRTLQPRRSFASRVGHIILRKHAEPSSPQAQHAEVPLDLLRDSGGWHVKPRLATGVRGGSLRRTSRFLTIQRGYGQLGGRREANEKSSGHPLLM